MEEISPYLSTTLVLKKYISLGTPFMLKEGQPTRNPFAKKTTTQITHYSHNKSLFCGKKISIQVSKQGEGKMTESKKKELKVRKRHFIGDAIGDQGKVKVGQKVVRGFVDQITSDILLAIFFLFS